jgi:hypothetical protein
MDANTATTLTSSGILSLIISALVGFVVKVIGDNQLAMMKHHLKHESDLALARVKADLERELAEARTQFDWVYQHRAQAAFDLYALLLELQASLGEYVRLLAHGKDPQDARDAQLRFSSALDRFNAFFPAKTMSLDDNVVQQLGAIAKLVGASEEPKPYDERALAGLIATVQLSLRQSLGGPLSREN